MSRPQLRVIDGGRSATALRIWDRSGYIPPPGPLIFAPSDAVAALRALPPEFRELAARLGHLETTPGQLAAIMRHHTEEK